MQFLPPGADDAPRVSMAQTISACCLGNGLRAHFCHGKHLPPRLSGQAKLLNGATVPGKHN